jgi:hypothetical protein
MERMRPFFSAINACLLAERVLWAEHVQLIRVDPSGSLANIHHYTAVLVSLETGAKRYVDVDPLGGTMTSIVTLVAPFLAQYGTKEKA